MSRADHTTTENPIEIDPAAFEAFTLKPHFECNSKGVFFIAVDTDKDGATTEKPPLKLADPIELIGHGTDTAGNHYRVIQYRDNLTRRRHTTALAMAEIGNAWGKLQGMGIAIMASRRKRELLADYLQTDGLHTPYTITAAAGWIESGQQKAYVLPSGEVLAEQGKQAMRVIYNGDKSQAAAFAESGSLEAWQAEIARYAAGNSRLSLAIGTALAAPLVSLLGMEAGGFHLFGDSRDGKSTAARAALSVWGNPAQLMASWTGTGHGFSNLALSRNDNLLVLDEIGQANPRHVSQTAYSVINGVSKIQGAKDGGNRDTSRWRVLMLSTGEKPLDSFLQAARLPSIPSDAGQGLGIFDTLHGHSKGSALSEALNQAAQCHHGTAGRAFIRLLLNHPAATEEARALMADFMATLPDTDGQARTVAARFAMAAAALELAARHGITGSPAGLAFPAIKQCFDAWIARTGGGKFEDMKIIKQTVDFMQTHGDSLRFIGWNDQQPYTNPSHAGYRRQAAAPDLPDELWIIPAVYESEICQSFEPAKVCAVLSSIRWLKRNEKEERWQHKKRGKGRFYVLLGIEPPEEIEP